MMMAAVMNSYSDVFDSAYYEHDDGRYCPLNWGHALLFVLTG